MKHCKKLFFILVFFLGTTFGKCFIHKTACEQIATDDSVVSFPQPGKFYTVVCRAVIWNIVDGKNITSHEEDFIKWSVKDVVDDVAYINRTDVYSYINPETGENYIAINDFDYRIATNRTILSAYWKWMCFNTAGFLGLDERPFDEDVGEHTWAWFPTNFSIGAYVNVSWTGDRRFLGDTQYEVIGEETIEILGKKQECWLLYMPPVKTDDATQGRTDTWWVDKDTGIPVKDYCLGWSLDGLFGFAANLVLTNTNIDLGPESTETQSLTYTLTVPTDAGFPEAGKFWTYYFLESGWYMRGKSNSAYSNVTYSTEGLLTLWIVNITGDQAFVMRILWYEYMCPEEGAEQLEALRIQYYNYTISISTREILSASGSFYLINMSSLTYNIEDRTSQLAGDIGEETWYWLPKNLYLGAVVSISWTRDMPWNVDNSTYTVTDETIIDILGKPQACWMLHMPLTSSIDGTWNYTEIIYSDKDVGIPLGIIGKGWALDESSLAEYTLQFIDTNVDAGPQTYVFVVVADSQTFYVVVVTNSTIPMDNFAFSQGDMKVSYNVTGPDETTGFCNVTIPKELLEGPWSVWVGSEAIVPDVDENGNYTYLYFQYNHSTHLIRIFGSWVIPEFSATLMQALLLTTAVLVIITSRRKK